MKQIEIIVTNKYNPNKVNEVYTINHTEERARRIGMLDGCVKISDNDEKTSFIYRDNKMKGVILYRGFIKPYKTEDWLNTFPNK